MVSFILPSGRVVRLPENEIPKDGDKIVLSMPAGKYKLTVNGRTVGEYEILPTEWNTGPITFERTQG